MIKWLKSLMEKKEVKKIKPRKKRKQLTSADVLTIENAMDMYDRATIMDYFDISKNTYYVIRSRSHRYSSKVE